MSDKRWQSHDGVFEQAEQAESTPIPEGTYQVELTDLELDQHPRWNDEQVRWGLRVLAGEHEGAHLIKWHSLDRDRVKYLVKDCARLGVPIRRLSELEVKRPQLLGAAIEVEVRYKEVPPGKNWDPEQQIWFVALLDGPAQAAPPKASLAPAPKSVPKVSLAPAQDYTAPEDEIPF